MLADPQSITVNAVAISLPRVGTGNNTSSYQSADGNNHLSVAHTYGKRTRRVTRFDFSKIAADPFVSGQNNKYSGSVYLVIDAPIVGFTAAELKLQIDGFLSYLTASSGAKVTSILGGES